MAASAPGLGRICWSSRQQMLSMLSQYHYHSHQTYIQSSSNRTLQLAWLMICQSRAINGADFAGGLALSARVGAPPTESVRSTSWSNVTWSPEPWQAATSSFMPLNATPALAWDMSSSYWQFKTKIFLSSPFLSWWNSITSIVRFNVFTSTAI